MYLQFMFRAKKANNSSFTIQLKVRGINRHIFEGGTVALIAPVSGHYSWEV